MGRIKNLQLDYLEGGQEQINFKVYDPDGTYIRTEDVDLLYKTKRDLTPLNVDLVKEYERPLKKVSLETNLSNLYYKNENAHFLYGDEKFVTQPPVTGTAGIISSDDQPVSALSGSKYFKSTELTLDTSAIAMLTISREHLSFPQGKPMTIGFNYYIATSDKTDKFELRMKAGLQDTYSVGVYDKEYDFENNEWINFNGQTGNMKVTTTETQTVNSWGKFTAEIKPYFSDSSDDDVSIDVVICKLRNAPVGTNSDFSAIYIDNFFIAETVEFSDNKVISTRTQDPNNGTFSAHDTKKDFMLSNEAENADYFIGKIEGNFKRQRDSVGKKLEQCITAEILNDYRAYFSRYEGTFRDKRITPMGFHNKIHIDFGSDVFQEENSCYIDTMKFVVKAAEYDISMHVPNQDDDVSSFYVTQFE